MYWVNVMNNKEFLQVIASSFNKFLTTGSRSNEKLKVLHGAIAKDILNRLDDNRYSILSLGIDTGKEGNITGRYIDKKVDITIMRNNKIVAGIGVKFVMQNYSQNSNNYFENMLGETANIRSQNIPYFQIFIIPDKIPYYDNNGSIKKWEEFSQHNIKKYLILSKDSIATYIHTPTKTLLFVIHLPTINKKVLTKQDYINYYQSQPNILIDKTMYKYDDFSSNVIFNDYECFINKVILYLKFIE